MNSSLASVFPSRSAKSARSYKTSASKDFAVEQRERYLPKLLGLLVLRSRTRQERRPLVYERPHLRSEVVLRLQLETQVDSAHCHQQPNRERTCQAPPETNRSVRRVEKRCFSGEQLGPVEEGGHFSQLSCAPKPFSFAAEPFPLGDRRRKATAERTALRIFLEPTLQRGPGADQRFVSDFVRRALRGFADYQKAPLDHCRQRCPIGLVLGSKISFRVSGAGPLQRHQQWQQAPRRSALIGR